MDFLLQRDVALSRRDAVECLEELFAAGAFTHVHDEHAFKDKFLFYRCNAEIPRSSSGEASRALSSTASSAGGGDVAAAALADDLDVDEFGEDIAEVDELDGDVFDAGSADGNADGRRSPDSSAPVETGSARRTLGAALPPLLAAAAEEEGGGALEEAPMAKTHRLAESDPAGLMARSPLFRRSPHVLCSGVFEPLVPSLGGGEGALRSCTLKRSLLSVRFVNQVTTLTTLTTLRLRCRARALSLSLSLSSTKTRSSRTKCRCALSHAATSRWHSAVSAPTSCGGAPSRCRSAQSRHT